eukprot:PITA_19308
MDDFTPYGYNFQEALTNLRKVLAKCIEMNLSLSPKKCQFLMTEGTVLGHTISQQGLQVDPNKIAIIQRVPPPQKVRDVWSFLGLTRYYRRFIKDFSKLASPLFGLLGKDDEFIWTDSCQETLDALKGKLVTSPILRGPNWALAFHIHVDASNKSIGAALGQVEEKLPYAIYFVSRNLSKEELNYAVTKKELLAIVHSLNKFRHYIIDYKTFINTNHAVTRELITDQGSQLTSNLVEDLLTHHKIKHRTSTPYHPQENGQVEVTNRALEGILTNVVSRNKKDLVDRLVEATWAYNTTWKTTTGFTPYELVYGKKALLSIEFEYNTLKMAAQLDLDLSHVQKEILLQLNGLDEQRMQALLHSEAVQLQRKIWHVRHLKEKPFQQGDWALLHDSRYKDFKGKLMTRWLGPYTVEKCNDNGSALIWTIDEEAISMLVNGHRLKIYRKPLSKQEFIENLRKTVLVVE